MPRKLVPLRQLADEAEADGVCLVVDPDDVAEIDPDELTEVEENPDDSEG